MKVHELIKQLTEELNPDEEVCVLVWDKAMFEFQDDDELFLTDEGWERVVKDFEAESHSNLWSAISDACMDYAEMRFIDEGEK